MRVEEARLRARRCASSVRSSSAGGLLLILWPTTVSNDTFGVSGRSCGSVLFPTQESFSGENAVLMDWIVERDCRKSQSVLTWGALLALDVGAFLTLAASLPPRQVREPE